MKAIICILFSALGVNAAQPFSVAHWSDPHTGAYVNGTNAEALLNFVIARTNDGTWNFKGMMITGDVYEQKTNYYTPGDNLYNSNLWQLAAMTNGLNRLISNGIFCIPGPGNHDADDSSDTFGSWTPFGEHAALAWTNVFPRAWYAKQTNFVTGLRYVTNYGAIDTRQVCLAFTNSGIKLLFASYSASYTNDGTYYTNTVAQQLAPMTLLITNQIKAFPDHNAIVLAHYMMAYDLGVRTLQSPYKFERRFPFFHTNDHFFYRNIGPSYIAFDQGLTDCTNLLAVCSGHTQSLKKGHILQRKSTGGFVDVQCFNLQNDAADSYPLNGQALAVLTFYPDQKKVTMRTVNTLTGQIYSNYDTNISMTSVSGAAHVYEQTWTRPLAVPNLRRIFRIR